MKVFIVGSKSIHIEKYILALRNHIQNIVFLGEENCYYSKNEYVISFRTLNPIALIINYFKLYKVIKNENPNCIHIHQINRLAFVVALIAKRLNIPFVTTAWGSDVLLIPHKNILYFHLVKYVLKQASIVTADSSEMITVMNRIYCHSSKYKLLQYGIDPIESKEKRDIIFSNRLHKSLYRIDVIIRYFAEFTKRNLTYRLIIAGNGSETEKLKQLVDELKISDQVEFVGWLNHSENSYYYSHAKFYISLPESDGTSVSVLEAMLGGCIPILSDLAVSREWITDGVNGVIEKANTNPFEVALTIDIQKCILFNRELVGHKALRGNTILEFINHYNHIFK